MKRPYNFNRNVVEFAGRVTTPPKFRTNNLGIPTITFGLAINSAHKTKDGGYQSDTLFVNCRATHKQATNLNEFLRKSSELLVSGKLKMYKNDDQRVSYEVLVDHYLPGPSYNVESDSNDKVVMTESGELNFNR
jgi:single-stranded DNA-binding protein